MELRSKTLERLDSFKLDDAKEEDSGFDDVNTNHNKKNISRSASGLLLRRSVSHYLEDRISRHCLKRTLSHFETETKSANRFVPRKFLDRSISDSAAAVENRTDQQIFKRLVSALETDEDGDYDDDKAAANLEEEEIETGSVMCIMSYNNALANTSITRRLILAG